MLYFSINRQQDWEGVSPSQHCITLIFLCCTILYCMAVFALIRSGGKSAVITLPLHMDPKNIHWIDHYFLLWDILCPCLSLTVLEEARTELFKEQRSSTYSKGIFYLSNPSMDKMAEFHYLALRYNDPTSRGNQDAICKMSGQHHQ